MFLIGFFLNLKIAAIITAIIIPAIAMIIEDSEESSVSTTGLACADSAWVRKYVNSTGPGGYSIFILSSSSLMSIGNVVIPTTKEFTGISNENSVGESTAKDQTFPFFETSEYVS